MTPADSGKRDRDRRYNAKRPDWVRWYKTPAWRAKAKRQLTASPLCAIHRKRGEQVKATIADHVDPHRGDRNKFWRGALQSLCASCHSGVKQALERGDRAGCDLTGMPVDPTHPWAARHSPTE